ncbi:hypothetical protein GCM10025857_27270 [Alicyclobacillus contaminans]|nr:hypothetical protein GCM10025857_27270 [Alicyclobacillus contaminans]
MFALRYFEMGEREAMRTIGVKIGDVRRGGTEFPRVHLVCDYHRPLYYDDVIEIRTVCRAIGRSSITWGHQIYRDGELCISGQMKVVHVDSQTGRPRRVPDAWRAHLLGD